MYRMKISEMASRAGVSAATLRYYDKKGILVPEYLDENTGYRYYSRQQLIKLSIINFMRELGLGIEEIKHMLETDDAESIHQALVLRREKIIDQMKTLAQQKNVLSSIIDSYDLLQNHPDCGKPFLKTIPERYLYFFEVEESFNNLGYSQGYEQSLIDMMEEMMYLGIHGSAYINVGSVITSENVSRGIIKPSRVYALVAKEFCGVPGVVKMPENVYICNICEEPENEVLYLKMLYAESERRELIAGDYFREEIILYPHMREGRRDGLYLQAVPVKI